MKLTLACKCRSMPCHVSCQHTKALGKRCTKVKHQRWSFSIQLHPHLLPFPARMQQLTPCQDLLQLIRSYSLYDFCMHMRGWLCSEKGDRLSNA